MEAAGAGHGIRALSGSGPDWAEAGILRADTITKLPPEAAGAVVVSGSHGGRYPGYVAAKAGARAVVLNDAGIGRDGAGIASLPYMDALGLAAATVSHLSCRIGDTADMLARGRISHVNRAAAALGVEPGQATIEAARRLAAAPESLAPAPPPVGEGRAALREPGWRRPIALLDSAALVGPEDVGAIVATGSHGGLIGGNPVLALKADCYAAAFNDAGGGPEGAGMTRLPALDARGIAAITVSAASARIGEGASTFRDGIVSAANRTAEGWGARPGISAAELLTAWALRA